MKIVGLVVGAVASAVWTAGAFEIGEAMKDEAFWKSDPVLFVSKHQSDGFKFTSDTREAADSRRDGAVMCFGMPVYETKVSFGGGGIRGVEVMLYNRGGAERLEEVDLGDGSKVGRVKLVGKALSKSEFGGIIESVRSKLTLPGKKPPRSVQQRMKDSDIRQSTQVWCSSALPGTVTLTWNYEQGAKKSATFTPGFIRLAVESAKVGSGVKSGGKSGDGGGKGIGKFTDNVVKETRGDVFVDGVPMVDQGQKGYCAAATAERVLRYFGLDVDEHEFAVMAKTEAVGGTYAKEMIATFTAMGKRHRFATQVLYGDADKGVEERIANLADEVRQYNKAAKRLKKPQIADDDYITRSGNMISYSPAAVDAKRDPEVLKDLKVNRSGKPQYMKFMKNVRQYVGEGKPLVWGVTLGMYPEPDIPQAKGGHVRLIIGYNDKKGEILYSDSWGNGHELKRMPADWAWTISTCLIAIRPLYEARK